MKDRILQLMQEEALTNAEFAKKIGISASALSHITTGRNEISLRVALLIHKAYPSINLDWLLYGEGEMRKADTPETTVSSFSGSSFDFRKENASSLPNNTSKDVVREEVKYIEKPQPKIVEIRIFFDNGTFQVFRPEKS